MKINELIIEQQIDELSAAGVGQGIGKAAGSVVRGAGDFFKGMKQGYQAGRAPTASPSAPSTDTTSIKDQIAQKKQEIADLEKQLSQPAPGIGQASNQVAGVASNTPEPAPAAQPASTEQPPVEPGIGNNQNQVKATASNTAKPAALSPAQIRKQKQAAAAQAAQAQMKAKPAAPAQATQPAPTPAEVRQQKQATAAQTAQSQMVAAPAQQPATAQPAADDPTLASLSDAELQADLAKKSDDAVARAAKRDLGPRLNAMVQAELQKRQAQPTAPAQEPAANKPSPDAIKQAQLKKNLMKNQQARTAAPAAPSGFSASGVGQARQRTYAGAGGAPKSYVVRENVGFYSKFLDKEI